MIKHRHWQGSGRDEEGNNYMLIMIAEIIDFPHKEDRRKLFCTIIRERSGGKVKWDSYTCPEIDTKPQQQGHLPTDR